MIKQKKIIILFCLAIAAMVFLFPRLKLQQDLVRVIENYNPDLAALFLKANQNSISNEKIYVKISDLDQVNQTALVDQIQKYGYQQVSLFDHNLDLYHFAIAVSPYVLSEDVNSIVGKFDLQAYTQEVQSLLYLPGTEGVLRLKLNDPLGITEKVFKRIFPKQNLLNQAEKSVVLVFERKGDINFEKVHQLVKFLQEKPNDLLWTGADFFALENYQVVQRDLMICTTVSIVATIIIFYYFTSSFLLLLILLIGTAFSYLVGLVTIHAIYGYVYAVVLTFTSTFIGFNNEYLVHFSALNKEKRRNQIIGLGSAIGTTFIGFFILLFTKSELLFQIGVVSLGAMAGFLFFLYCFSDSLRKIQFRSFNFPTFENKQNAFSHNLFLLSVSCPTPERDVI